MLISKAAYRLLTNGRVSTIESWKYKAERQNLLPSIQAHGQVGGRLILHDPIFWDHQLIEWVLQTRLEAIPCVDKTNIGTDRSIRRREKAFGFVILRIDFSIISFVRMDETGFDLSLFYRTKQFAKRINHSWPLWVLGHPRPKCSDTWHIWHMTHKRMSCWRHKYIWTCTTPVRVCCLQVWLSEVKMRISWLNETVFWAAGSHPEPPGDY